MANKLSTSEILAAARAADGRQPSPQKSVAADKLRVGVTRKVLSDDLTVKQVPDSPEEESVRPDSMRMLLERVRETSNVAPIEELRPAALGEVLKDVRRLAGTGLPEPRSMSKILLQVRQETGSSPLTASSTQGVRLEKKPVDRPALGRPSTAEILAAARKPVSEKPDPRPVPSASNRKAGSGPSTADILAAARKQGAVSAADRPDRPLNSHTAKKPSVRAAKSIPDVATAVRGPAPVAISEVLQAVRREAAGQQALAPPLPPLAEMVRELRLMAHRPVARRGDVAEKEGWTNRFQRWLNRVNGTHQGASI